jgi:hypothetical protein
VRGSQRVERAQLAECSLTPHPPAAASPLQGRGGTTPLLDRRHVLALIAALSVWQLADWAEARLPLSLAWAVIDEFGHAAVAASIMLWTWPAWGWRPLLAAILAATLIDVDHALAAGSLLPERMMSLASRPAAHSLLGASVATAVGTTLGGRRIGYAALVGVLTHLARDAQAAPGIPLLVPWGADWHMRLPIWVLPVLMVILSAQAISVRRALE